MKAVETDELSRIKQKENACFQINDVAVLPLMRITKLNTSQSIAYNFPLNVYVSRLILQAHK